MMAARGGKKESREPLGQAAPRRRRGSPRRPGKDEEEREGRGCRHGPFRPHPAAPRARRPPGPQRLRGPGGTGRGAATGAHRPRCKCGWRRFCSRCARARRSCSSSRAGTGRTSASSPRSWRGRRGVPLPQPPQPRGAQRPSGRLRLWRRPPARPQPRREAAPRLAPLAGSGEAGARGRRSAAGRRRQAAGNHLPPALGAVPAPRNGGRGGAALLRPAPHPRPPPLFLGRGGGSGHRPCCGAGAGGEAAFPCGLLLSLPRRMPRGLAEGPGLVFKLRGAARDSPARKVVLGLVSRWGVPCVKEAKEEEGPTHSQLQSPKIAQKVVFCLFLACLFLRKAVCVITNFRCDEQQSETDGRNCHGGEERLWQRHCTATRKACDKTEGSGSQL